MAHCQPIGFSPGPFCVRVAAVAILLGAAASAPARAQVALQQAGCSLTANAPPDVVIRDCTEVLSARNGNARQGAADLIVRGRAYRATGRLDAAIVDYTEAIALDPAAALAYYSRGIAYFSKGEFDRAVADYSDALRLRPGDVLTLQNRGHAYQAKADYAPAIADYSQAINLEPRFASAYNDRCYARTLSGRDLPQALADCNEALKLVPNDSHTLDSRALTYLKLGDFKNAIGDYSAILARDPRSASSQYGRGLAKLKSGDTAGGNADIAAAKAMRPAIDAVFSRYGIH